MNTPSSGTLSMEDNEKPRHRFDVVIIGAGVSGINTARYLKTHAPRGTSYVILESRANFGGTWDLFKYPGIRSDSDMFTFGFSWKPWQSHKPLAGGAEIASYLASAADESGAAQNTRFHHRVLSADWSSASSTWTVVAQKDEEVVEFEAGFVVLGTGYYNYDEPLRAPIPGLEQFRGDVIHPQFWPSNYDYMNKEIVVVGSGATGVTLLPSLAVDARRVTMLQRSPTYVATLPMSRGILTRIFQTILPSFITNRLIRIQHILLGYLLYYFCRAYPKKARKALETASKRQLPLSVPVDPHLSPRYAPWDQRLCVCPDGDFYTALRSGKAKIVTDKIKRVVEDGIELESGKKLHTDIIVTATGLQLQFAGRIQISVDGKVVDPSEKFTWKGCMLQDVPNLAFVIGYVNASWTLSAETTATLVTRLLRRMKDSRAKVATPRLKNPQEMPVVPLFNLSSTYFKGASTLFPKGGVGQWAQKKNHIVDAWESSWGDLSTGLEVR